MRAFPSTKHERFNLLLFPFKAYLVLAYPFYFVFRAFCPQPFLGTMVSDGTFEAILMGGAFCLFVLLIGSGVQWLVSGWEFALRSLAFVLVPVALILIILVLRLI